MSAPAVQVENLSKRYRIGWRETRQDTLVGRARQLLGRPFRNLAQLRQLTHFADDEGEERHVIWALRDLSFTIDQGDVVGMVGANGAGKSTLLKILSRITSPTAGRAVLRGRVSSLLEVGTGFHPELTGRENVYLNGTILGMRKREIDRKFDQIIDFAGIGKFIDTPVKRYSSGMGVRLAFSVAAHLDPEILLVDEVLAVGDAAFQQRCLGKVGEVARQGRTVLLVSHNMGSILRFCPRTLWLKEGRLKRFGDSDGVVKDYLGASLAEDEPAERSRSLGLELNGVVLEELWVDRPGGPAMVSMGGPMRFHLRLRGVADPDRTRIALMVDDALTGARVFTLSTDAAAHDPLRELADGADVLTCEVAEVRLLPGTYSVSVALNVAVETRYHERALSFTVIPADVFGTGIIPGRNRGLVYARARWAAERARRPVPAPSLRAP